MLTTIKKNIGHDRMTFTATFPNGDVLKFNISRASDRWSATQKPGTARITQEQFTAVTKLGAMAPDGNHLDRYTRMEALCLRANSLAQLSTMAG